MTALTVTAAPPLDYRELVMLDLADAEARLAEDLARMVERYETAEGAAITYRELSHVAITMSARLLYQRDKAYGALYRQRDRARAQRESVA
jgi:hypothetical protein